MPLRFAHFSDVHLTAQPLGWRARDFVSKRMLGLFNVRFLGRGRRFKHAPQVADVLLAEIRAGNFDHLIFSGDATKLGFESEFEHAARRLGVGELPGLAVPGNHDYYTRRCAKSGRFERYFRPWLDGLRVDGATYPFAHKVGSAWLIGVNSSLPKFLNVGASASIGQQQLHRLRKLCEQLDAGPRILVTHYPLRESRGRVERRSHRLRDHAAAIEAAKDCRISLWLHGHIHKGYVLLPTAEIPFPTICAGSATQTHRWMYNQYELEGDLLTMTRRVFDPTIGLYKPESQQIITLR